MVNNHAPLSVATAITRHEQLAAVSDSPRLDIELMLAACLEQNRAWLYAHGEHVLACDVALRFNNFVERRSAGEPVAYILGEQPFMDFTLKVTRDTLIPRPETELLVETTLAVVPKSSQRVVDAGTGTGAIAIALKRARPEWDVIATDVDATTLAVARDNMETSNVDIELMQTSWLDGFETHSLAAIVSNPPYIPVDDPHLEALDFEPTLALTAGVDGLDAIRIIVDQAHECLEPGGWLLLEHGYDQGEAVRALMEGRGFTEVITAQDLSGNDRVTRGRT